VPPLLRQHAPESGRDSVGTYSRSSLTAQVDIYCDGCSIPNPGRTGCGIVIPNQLEISRYLGDGSNQTAELHAMREALILARPADVIFSDSRYAVMLITGRWRAKAHKDLVSEVKRLRTPGVAIKWIHGHAGNEWQERADRLAKRAALKRVSFQNVLSAGVVDAPADNRPEGNIAPIGVNSAVGERV
jgi:ribonuclease HI